MFIDRSKALWEAAMRAIFKRVLPNTAVARMAASYDAFSRCYFVQKSAFLIPSASGSNVYSVTPALRCAS